MTQEQLDLVYKLMVKNFKIKLEDIKPESSFEEDFKADSLDVIEFFIDLEDELHLENIDYSELQNKISTVQDVLNELEKLLNK